jgi:hypothetical protein
MNSWYVILEHELTNPRNFRNRGKTALEQQPVGRPMFTHSPQGPRPRAANFWGRHIKKNRDWSMVWGKKGCPRERNLREIYTENNVGTTARLSFLVTTLLVLKGAEAIAYWLPTIHAFGSVCPPVAFCLHIIEYKQIRRGGGGGAQNFFGPRGVKYLNTGLPVGTTSFGNRSKHKANTNKCIHW